MKGTIKLSFAVLLCLQCYVWAQQPRLRGIYSDKKNITARTARVDTVADPKSKHSLPFFDNFILTGSDNTPNPLLWCNGGGVKISNTMTKSNPDFNAAIFDGTDSSGTPYSFASPTKRGVTDSLVSQYIDLSNVTIPADRNTDSVLCLTFFVQNGGYGEVADGREGDQFSLSFKNKSGGWEQVWARKDTMPSITDTAVVDRSYKDFFRNVYKPELFLNTLNDSVNYIKKIYPKLADYAVTDQPLIDSMKYFYAAWATRPDFTTKSSKSDSIDFFKQVYPWDVNFETNYKAFFKNIYHGRKNFGVDTVSRSPLVVINDSLEYFKKMYPNELFPEAYYRVFFGTLKLLPGGIPIEDQAYYKFLPFFYQSFKSDKKEIDDYTLLYDKEKDETLKKKLGTLLDSVKAAHKLDSIKYYRKIVSAHVTESIQNYSRYEYIFDKSSDDRFLDSNFRMAFVAQGRQSGAFDVWGLDYVFLRKAKLRINNNITTRKVFSIPDASISAQLSGILKHYASMPLKHIDSSTAFMDSVVVQEFDFSGEPRTSTDVIQLRYDDITDGSQFIGSIDFDGLPALDNDRFSVTGLMPTPSKIVLDKSKDYLKILSTALLYNHNKDSNINNDTIKTTTILSNYYAYDDGSAERALEFSGRYSELAYKFKCPSDSHQLTQVRAYFPKIISSNSGKSFTLKVWKTISDPKNGRRQDSVLYSAVKVITYPEKGADSLSGFVEFNIDSVVKVVDSFYVGYELLTADPIYTGFDLSPNINSAKNIYYNTDGDWEQYSSNEGNLMLRPVFGKYRKGGGDRKGETSFSKDYNVYPNPTQGNEVTIAGELPIKLRIYDILGGQQTNYSYDPDAGKLNVTGLKSGIYTLKIIGPDVIVYKKIIVN